MPSRYCLETFGEVSALRTLNPRGYSSMRYSDTSVFVVIATAFIGMELSSASEELCASKHGDNLKISTVFDKIPRKGWIRVFKVQKYARKTSDKIQLNVVLDTTSCGKVKIHKVDGKFLEDKKLIFHRRCGENAVVSPDGAMAYHNNSLEGFATVITNRPLERGELFQVKANGSFNIGITWASPEKVVFPEFMHSATRDVLSAWTWITPYTIKHGKKEFAYGPAFNPFRKEDVLGVKLKKDNQLHFYQRGSDVGRVTKITGVVYGFIDLDLGTKAEIVYERGPLST